MIRDRLLRRSDAPSAYRSDGHFPRQQTIAKSTVGTGWRLGPAPEVGSPSTRTGLSRQGSLPATWTWSKRRRLALQAAARRQPHSVVGVVGHHREELSVSLRIPRDAETRVGAPECKHAVWNPSPVIVRHPVGPFFARRNADSARVRGLPDALPRDVRVFVRVQHPCLLYTSDAADE